jgi:hypothetical protein
MKQNLTSVLSLQAPSFTSTDVQNLESWEVAEKGKSVWGGQLWSFPRSGHEWNCADGCTASHGGGCEPVVYTQRKEDSWKVILTTQSKCCSNLCWDKWETKPNKQDWGCSSVVEHWPSICEAWASSLTPQTNKQTAYLSLTILIFFLFGGTGVWPQGFILENQVLYAWATPPVHFVLVILEMGSHDLFAQAGLKLLISASQLVRIIGVSHQDRVLVFLRTYSNLHQHVQRTFCLLSNYSFKLLNYFGIIL